MHLEWLERLRIGQFLRGFEFRRGFEILGDFEILGGLESLLVLERRLLLVRLQGLVRLLRLEILRGFEGVRGFQWDERVRRRRGGARARVRSPRHGVGTVALDARQLVLQVGDRDVTLAHGPGDLVQGRVGDLHVVSPHGARRAQQGDVRGGDGAEVERGVIGLLVGQFAAPPGRDEEDAGQHDGDRDEHENRHT